MQVNPFQLLEKLKKIKSELPQLRKDCEEIIEAKQEAIQLTREVLLVKNRSVIHKLHQLSGLKERDWIKNTNEDIFNDFTAKVREQHEEWKSNK